MSGRIAVVVNGNAKSVSEEVIETLDDILDGSDLYVSRRIEDAGAIARNLIDRQYDTILTGGGDGTFSVLVTAVVHEARARGIEPPRFGLLRLGTGNSLAWVVGASTPGAGKRSKGALSADISRLRSDAGSRLLPLVSVEDKLSPFCGFGIDANVLADYGATKAWFNKTPLGPWANGIVAYAVAATTRTIPGYLMKATPHCRVRNLGAPAVAVRGHLRNSPPIETGAIIYEGPATICAASTIPYYGFGFRMFPGAGEVENRMQLRISTVSSYLFVKNFPAIWAGTYENSEVLFDYYVDDVEIEMDPATNFQIGGDIQGQRTRVRIETAPPIRIVDFYSPPRG